MCLFLQESYQWFYARLAPACLTASLVARGCCIVDETAHVHAAVACSCFCGLGNSVPNNLCSATRWVANSSPPPRGYFRAISPPSARARARHFHQACALMRQCARAVEQSKPKRFIAPSHRTPALAAAAATRNAFVARPFFVPRYNRGVKQRARGLLHVLQHIVQVHHVH